MALEEQENKIQNDGDFANEDGFVLIAEDEEKIPTNQTNEIEAVLDSQEEKIAPDTDFQNENGFVLVTEKQNDEPNEQNG